MEFDIFLKYLLRISCVAENILNPLKFVFSYKMHDRLV